MPIRDFSRLDSFLKTLEGDVRPELPAEPHISITRNTITELRQRELLKPGSKVLDIGCGHGLALEVFRELGIEATGIALGADAALCRAKGFDVQEMDQSFMTFPDESFDLLWCRHVLQSSFAPFYTLTEYKRLMKPEGFLYIEVPEPETASHHEHRPNNYSVLPLVAWQHLFNRVGLKSLRGQRHSFTGDDGPDVYLAFLLRKADESWLKG